MKLYIALELSNNKWKIGFSDGKRMSVQSVDARDLSGFSQRLAQVRAKWFTQGQEVEMVSVYEAGRDGFWIHRWLSKIGIINVVVDPASIEVNRRKRRAKTDRLDTKSLLRQLMRYHGGEPKVWSVVRVPCEEVEDARRGEREIKRLKKEIGSGSSRVRSLLALHGITPGGLVRLKKNLDTLECWDGNPLPAGIRSEIARELDRIDFARSQLKDLEKSREESLAKPVSVAHRQAAKLMGLKGVGPISSMLLAGEFFSWREFANVRQVGACAGLVGCPYSSGDSQVEQGISKAGNAKVRTVMIELGWQWLRHQEQSDLARWFRENFDRGKRNRRVGIVALARKLLIAFWKYLEKDELPAGAALKEAF